MGARVDGMLFALQNFRKGDFNTVTPTRAVLDNSANFVAKVLAS
jgi:hypothetical protein